HSHLLLLLFNVPPPTELYTLSLHDALPISNPFDRLTERRDQRTRSWWKAAQLMRVPPWKHQTLRTHLFGPLQHPMRYAERPLDRSEEHTSELQSRENLVCRLLLEKKKKTKN